MAYASVISGIYQIKNLVNGKVYVGSSVNIESRWRQHRSDLNKRRHHSKALQRAWDKYGAENFSFSVLEEVVDSALLFERETFHVSAMKSADGRSGYNTLVVGGSAAGYKHSDDARRRMSEAQRRIPYEKRLEYCVSFAGRKHTEETKAKMSSSSKRVSPSAEHRQRISEIHRGKTISPEHRAIVGAATALKNKTPEMRAKVSAALKGRVMTPEWREKLSIAAKKRSAKSCQRRTDASQSRHVLDGE